MKDTLHRRLRSFRDLSRQFTEREARPSFVLELLLFALIVAITAWPLAAMTDALAKPLP